MRDNVGLDQAERSLRLHRQSVALRHNAWLLREEVAAARRRLDEVNTWLVRLRSQLRRHLLPPPTERDAPLLILCVRTA